MNVEQPDGTLKRVEGNEAEAAFRADPGPCKLNVPASTRRFGVQRHRGEGIRAMIERLNPKKVWL